MLMHIERECRKVGRNLEEESIGWMPDGKAIVVRDQATLCETWLPLFFGQTKYSSFTRKLYRWEFRKLNVASEPAPQNWVYFRNDNFQRDHVDLRKNMKSVTAIKLRNEAAATRAVQNNTDQISAVPPGLFGNQGTSGSGVASTEQLPIASGSASAARSSLLSQNFVPGFPWSAELQGSLGHQMLHQPNFTVPSIPPSSTSASDNNLLQAMLAIQGSQQQNHAQQSPFVALDRALQGSFNAHNTDQQSIDLSTDYALQSEARGPTNQQGSQDMHTSGRTTSAYQRLGQAPQDQPSMSAPFSHGHIDTSSRQSSTIDIVQLLLLQHQLQQTAAAIPNPPSVAQMPSRATHPHNDQASPSTNQAELLALLPQLGTPMASGSTAVSQQHQSQPWRGQNPPQFNQETMAFLLNLLAQISQGQSGSSSQ